MTIRAPKFDWSLNLGHVLMIASLLVGTLVWGLRLEGQVAMQAVRIDSLERYLGDLSQDISEVKQGVDDINAYLRDRQ